ncbi:MAG: beta-ketoacyl synthase [Ferruginibacter sp.]|nr:beta-ketoacyl synthase [Ferruginibacter sp.]
MKDVFIVADNIISPLGVSSAENFTGLTKGLTGIQQQHAPALSDIPFYASLLSDTHERLAEKNSSYTKFEQLLIASVSSALENSKIDIRDKKTILIISSTKGNISLVENATITPQLKNRVALHTSANLVAAYFHCTNTPVVVSNACISGLLAIITGRRLIQSGQYDHAVVVGADLVSKFVLSGFQSFQAISSSPCKPFDAARDGINLGEGAGTVILSSNKDFSQGITVTGGAVSNDANHISGPSRTGEELCQAIMKAMQDAAISKNDIGLISAHGTATVYNDEMEALAISLAGLQEVPVNSLKGYYGHTLGAAGIIESVVAIHSLQHNLILPSMGFSQQGVTKVLNVSRSLQTASLKNCLKTGSGFGGCNAAVIFNRA